ncbi:dihydroxyacetone phosphate acyltransferase-like [Hydractinia symbiolongicarpus]|uniref:dihydroxyacetone phosphate acyltransferase-like n=1 Tax=Hydractinia symbiolongicarpus TaxID=13093 RepID=UPI00254E909A|nr:dihydroxyacetone phosphate acyltransferase-like [Hydractinia symbiolongicarpus]
MTSREDWIDITDTHQFDVLWAFRKYECPKYMFAGEYNRQKIKESVLKAHRIKDAIEKYKQEKEVDLNTAYTQASDIIDEISHAFSISTIRLMALVLMKIIRTLFRHVLVNKKGLETFRKCVKHTPIVLVPTHNSYFDFLLASYICFAMDLPLPAIVSGQDFLSMAVVNHLLRGSGAFYMRRSFASDSFYRSIFTEYTQQVLCSGERPIEFFPEGTRSRSAKALQPKVGLLSMVLESFFHGYVQDVSFIPMSISFEKITEEQLYMFELLGLPKPKESLSGLLKARSILKSDFGTVSVHFGEVMSLREYCLGKINGMDYVNIPRCERHLKIFGREAQEMQIAKYFGEKLIHTQQSNMVIYPRCVVATLLLHKNGESMKLADISYQVDKIGSMLRRFGCKMLDFEDILTNKVKVQKAVEMSDLVLSIDSDEHVKYCYSTLTDESMKQTNLYKTFGSESDLISKSLGYIYISRQRNKLMHSCLLPAIFLHSLNVGQQEEEINRLFVFLCELFKIEFIFDPDVTVKQSFTETMDTLTQLNIIRSSFQLNEVKTDEITFLLALLQPFIDAYLIVIESILTNSFDYPVSLKTMTTSLQLLAASVIKNTHLDTYECLSLNMLSNAVTSLCKNRLLLTVKNENFENLINDVNSEKLQITKRTLVRFASSKLKTGFSKARL